MKRKAIFATGVFCLVFLLAGAFIVAKVKAGTDSLDMLIRLHQVEILREHLLTHAKTVQSGLKSKDSRFSEGPDAIVQYVREMEAASKKCFTCHHSEDAKRRLEDLQDHIQRYERAISRVLTVVADSDRLSREEDQAFHVGSELLDKLHDLQAFTSRKLRHRTYQALAGIQRTNLIVYLLLAAGPLLAVALAVMFVRSFARPVGLLLEGTRKLEQGDLDHRVAGLKEEFQVVGDSFNRMAQSLKDQMARMQRAEQLAVCGELAAGLGHEIRNPLNAIRVSLQVLSEDLALPSEDEKILTRVRDEVDHIETLMKNLLEYARPPRPEYTSVDVNDVIETALMFSMHHRLAAAEGGRQVAVTSALDPNLPKTVADPKQLLQICLNLLLNAVEAMPEGGTVTASTCLEGGRIRIDISDTGPGVDDAIRHRIFEPFFTKKSSGTGLGLAITKRLVEQHGGSIEVSGSEGGGARFSVTLPVRSLGSEASGAA